MERHLRTGESELPGAEFVVTPQLEALATRAMLYLEAGLPVHLSGPAGVGKTSLALHLARQRGLPVHIIFGNEAFQGFGLVGEVTGSRKRIVIDNYVHRVLKRLEETDTQWNDGELMRVVREGGTLVYDELTRSRPEANNVLLSILEEGLVALPAGRKGAHLMRVHPEFRVILTSNSTEYAGVRLSTDALRDRLVTLEMGSRDPAADAAIISGRTGLGSDEAAAVVEAVRRRQQREADSLRPALMIARVLRHSGVGALAGDAAFEAICDDVAGHVTGR